MKRPWLTLLALLVLWTSTVAMLQHTARASRYDDEITATLDDEVLPCTVAPTFACVDRPFEIVETQHVAIAITSRPVLPDAPKTSPPR